MESWIKEHLRQTVHHFGGIFDCGVETLMFLLKVFHPLEFLYDPELIDEREKRLKEGRISRGNEDYLRVVGRKVQKYQNIWGAMYNEIYKQLHTNLPFSFLTDFVYIHTYEIHAHQSWNEFCKGKVISERTLIEKWISSLLPIYFLNKCIL